MNFSGCYCCHKQILEGTLMRKNDHTVYITEEIRKIPVIYLLELEMSALDRLEKMIRDEVKRTSLALEWIQGIKNIKKASKDGGQNG